MSQCVFFSHSLPPDAPGINSIDISPSFSTPVCFYLNRGGSQATGLGRSDLGTGTRTGAARRFTGGTPGGPGGPGGPGDEDPVSWIELSHAAVCPVAYA